MCQTIAVDGKKESMGSRRIQIAKEIMAVIVLVIVGVSWWLPEYQASKTDPDTYYPARILSEERYFRNAMTGDIVYKVYPGQVVTHSKEFCVSLSDPDFLVERFREGGIEAQEAVEVDGVWLAPGVKPGKIYGETRGYWDNSALLVWRDQTFQVDEGCYHIDRLIEIPPALVPGHQYELILKHTYFINPYQKQRGVGVTRTAPSIVFHVVESPEDAD